MIAAESFLSAARFYRFVRLLIWNADAGAEVDEGKRRPEFLPVADGEMEDVFVVTADLFPVQFLGLYVHVDAFDYDLVVCGEWLVCTEFLVDTEFCRAACAFVHGEVRVDADANFFFCDAASTLMFWEAM